MGGLAVDLDWGVGREAILRVCSLLRRPSWEKRKNLLSKWKGTYLQLLRVLLQVLLGQHVVVILGRVVVAVVLSCLLDHQLLHD